MRDEIPCGSGSISPTAEAHQCPCCRHRSEHLLYLKSGSQIRRCIGCGAGRAVVPSFDPRTYYDDRYFSGGHADGYANYVGSVDVLKREFARTLDAIRRHGPAQGALLEVGCAYGYFLEVARSHYDVHGIELATTAVADCHRRGLHDVHAGEVTSALVDAIGPVDVIVLLDVIEHLARPAWVLETLVERLRPGGLIVITTGDFASLVARLAGPNWRLMTPPQHLWFFTPDSIQRLADALGLELVEVSHPWKIVPLSLIAYQFRRMLRLPQRAARIGSASIGLPLNLFDAMRVMLRKPGPTQ